MKYDYPVEGSMCNYTGNGTTGVSKHYISEFLINDINIAIIAAHLIAFPTDKARCSKREAQATILQVVINEYFEKGYEVIMMGDFNDYDDIVKDLNDDTPNSMVLDILKGISGDYSGNYLLHSAASLVTQDERFTEWYDSDGN